MSNAGEVPVPGLEPLPAELAALLDLERARPGAPAPVKERVWQGVDVVLAIPPQAALAPQASVPSAQAAPAAALTASAIAKGVVIFGVGCASGVMGHTWLTPPPAAPLPPPPALVAPLPDVSVPAKVEPSPPPAPAKAKPRPVETGVVAPPALHADTPATATDTALAGERSLLEQARMALARGEAQAALAALDGHARRYAHGQLVEEREALRVPVLMALGQTEQAKARAVEFNRRFPKSIFAPVVEAALKGAPKN
jgi:hypothetical protein